MKISHEIKKTVEICKRAREGDERRGENEGKGRSREEMRGEQSRGEERRGDEGRAEQRRGTEIESIDLTDMNSV